VTVRRACTNLATLQYGCFTVTVARQCEVPAASDCAFEAFQVLKKFPQ
jgi:hypothetical protein